MQQVSASVRHVKLRSRQKSFKHTCVPMCAILTRASKQEAYCATRATRACFSSSAAASRFSDPEVCVPRGHGCHRCLCDYIGIGFARGSPGRPSAGPQLCGPRGGADSRQFELLPGSSQLQPAPPRIPMQSSGAPLPTWLQDPPPPRLLFRAEPVVAGGKDEGPAGRNKAAALIPNRFGLVVEARWIEVFACREN